VISIAGTAISGNGGTSLEARGVDYDDVSGILTATPVTAGVPPPAFFLHTGASQHVLTPPLHLFPPSPCDGLVHAWNHEVIRTQDGKNPTTHFEVLLALGAAHQCTFVMTVSGEVFDSHGVLLTANVDTIAPTGH
jgi:hypothetical protein